MVGEFDHSDNAPAPAARGCAVSLSAGVEQRLSCSSTPYPWSIGVVGPPRSVVLGMTAGVACGSCGTGLRENAKFCDECGAPTAVSGDTAEYKQVTVLFADVVRSMNIAAVLDMERLREIQ